MEPFKILYKGDTVFNFSNNYLLILDSTKASCFEVSKAPMSRIQCVSTFFNKIIQNTRP